MSIDPNTNPSADDPGRDEDAPAPLSPEEYAELQKEAREEE
jgi:hypothetical protein